LLAFYRTPPKEVLSRGDAREFAFLGFACGNWKFVPHRVGRYLSMSTKSKCKLDAAENLKWKIPAVPNVDVQLQMLTGFLHSVGFFVET